MIFMIANEVFVFGESIDFGLVFGFCCDVL